MQELEPQLITRDELSSPVEERHIDYILEEEFSVSPEFLRFFLDEARRSAVDKELILESAEKSNCLAVRSATTDRGETDLLVKYGIQNDRLPVAILIEDKIRAGFQPDQAKRYRVRGEEGKNKEWSGYWTCLVAHTKYSVDQTDFDAVVTLQSLQQYFANKPDDRSRFRARILEQAIRKYESNGIQKIDSVMTRFRAMYAAECAKSFSPKQWEYDRARDAWWDDTWFLFRRTAWPKGVKVVHEARSGRIKLILPTEDTVPLCGVLEQSVSEYTDALTSKIKIVRVGKAKSAFQINVPKVKDFGAAQPPEFEEFFAAIEFLASYYGRWSAMLPEPLRISDHESEPPSEEDAEMRALGAMLLGFMRSTVARLGTAMPYPLPDIRKLTAATPDKERYFASRGLMGGFLLELHEDDNARPYIISDYWSRQWGSHSVRHKITTSEVLELADED